MQKEKYERADAEVIELRTRDVLVESDPFEEEYEGPGA